jgi:hypothetical protein
VGTYIKVELILNTPYACIWLPAVWKEDSMNEQFLIISLRACMQVLHPVSGRFFSQQAGVLALLMLASVACAVPVYAEEYDMIIEKNLFHDQRQKWEMEKSSSKRGASQAGARDNQNIDQINLFGTVIKDSKSYAVMRVTKPAAAGRSKSRGRRGAGSKKKGASGSKQSQDKKGPYAVGDFIAGYRIIAIHSESVLLQDPYDSKRYEIFMNDSQTERTAVRTEIAEDKPEPPPVALEKGRKPKRKTKKRSAPSPKADTSTDAIRQRFENDLQRMRD